jgi:hypothetical protein
MHVRRQHEPARNKERLYSHCGCVASVKIYFTLAVTRDTWVVGQVFRNKCGALESARWHAVLFELLVDVWKSSLIEGYLLGPQHTLQIIV